MNRKIIKVKISTKQFDILRKLPEFIPGYRVPSDIVRDSFQRKERGPIGALSTSRGNMIIIFRE